jgi:hypothetical protein
VADLPFTLADPLAARLRASLDVERKLPRALVSLGDLAGRDVILLDVPEGGVHAARLGEMGVRGRHLSAADPPFGGLAAESVDAVVALWSGFRGVEPAALAEVDRVLRPDGRLLVVHDYGRDDVSSLRPADAPEYVTWSRRDGPFLHDAGFRIHVVHCFWTFATIDDARSFLGEAFDMPGRALGERLRRPRVSWNVAVYHRGRGGAAA